MPNWPVLPMWKWSSASKKKKKHVTGNARICDIPEGGAIANSEGAATHDLLLVVRGRRPRLRSWGAVSMLTSPKQATLVTERRATSSARRATILLMVLALLELGRAQTHETRGLQ